MNYYYKTISFKMNYYYKVCGSDRSDKFSFLDKFRYGMIWTFIKSLEKIDNVFFYEITEKEFKNKKIEALLK